MRTESAVQFGGRARIKLAALGFGLDCDFGVRVGMRVV